MLRFWSLACVGIALIVLPPKSVLAEEVRHTYPGFMCQPVASAHHHVDGAAAPAESGALVQINEEGILYNVSSETLMVYCPIVGLAGENVSMPEYARVFLTGNGVNEARPDPFTCQIFVDFLNDSLAPQTLQIDTMYKDGSLWRLEFGVGDDNIAHSNPDLASSNMSTFSYYFFQCKLLPLAGIVQYFVNEEF